MSVSAVVPHFERRKRRWRWRVGRRREWELWVSKADALVMLSANSSASCPWVRGGREIFGFGCGLGEGWELWQEKCRL
jgi:hypothetical protein